MRYTLLAPSRRRPGAGLDGAELPMRAPPILAAASCVSCEHHRPVFEGFCAHPSFAGRSRMWEHGMRRLPQWCPILAAAPATVNEGSRAELRARLRHEVEQGLVAREEEIDPLPSSRPHQLASLGIGSIETAPASDDDIEGALREVRRG